MHRGIMSDSRAKMSNAVLFAISVCTRSRLRLNMLQLHAHRHQTSPQPDAVEDEYKGLMRQLSPFEVYKRRTLAERRAVRDRRNPGDYLPQYWVSLFVYVLCVVCVCL